HHSCFFFSSRRRHTRSKRDWSSDVCSSDLTAGGTMNPYSPTSMEEDVAIQASQAIGAHFSGVDLLLGSNNEPIVCEVNSNAHIRNLYDCTGINAAFDIVKYVT